MDGLASSESVDSPQVHISIHALYRCCLDTLSSISAVALHDESFKTYYARLKIWGAGLFTEGPSLDRILEEEPEKYRPLVFGLQNTLFSIAIEEVVFLKSRHLLDGNYDIRLQLDPQTKALLDLISQHDTTILACERRLPHLANTLTIGTPERLTLQSSSSQDLAPSGSNEEMTREDQSLMKQDARPGFINRIRKKLPAANEVISLSTKKEDAVDRVQTTSPGLGEHGLKEDSDARLHQTSEVCHEDYDIYLGDFVESLFDLLPSIRGIRRTRLLETEFHQSNERSSSFDLVNQAVPQAARTLPESGVQGDKDSTGSRTTKKQLQPPPYSDKLESSGTTMSFGFSVSDIIISYQLAFQIYHRYFTKAQGADIKYLQFGRDISSLGSSLQRLELIIKNAEEQSPEKSWRREADSTTATILNTLSEVTGDFKGTLRDCEKLLSDNSKFQRSATSFVDNVVWHSSTERAVNHLRQRVNLHLTKLNLIAKPLELHLLLRIQCELQQVQKDVAPLKGVLIQSTAQSIYPERPTSRDVRFNVPPDLAKRFERALETRKPDSAQVRDHLPLREGFDALVFHLASSTVKFEPTSGSGLNIPDATQFVNLVKSSWIMEKLKDTHHLQLAGPESLWADYISELDIEISDQLSRFETGELEQPTPDVISRLPDHCFAIWAYEEPLPRPAVLAERRPLEEKILELALPSQYDSRRSTLTVFRKSDVAFRLVSTTKDELSKDFHREESMDVNMNSTRFIPEFATSHEGESINQNVLLCNSQGQELKRYNFQDSSAVAQFQRALTGYRVSHNMSNISWHIGFNKFTKSISGKARLQFWHLEPLPNLLSALDSTTLVGSGSSVGASLQSVDGSTLVGSGSSVGASLQPSTLSTFPLSGSTRAAEITRSRADDIALIRPEPPVLVIFTQCERKYTFFHIRMDSSISAKRRPCEKCKNQNKPCSGILIQSSNRRWSFRRLSAQLENEQGLDSWDLACFRYPEHPAFQNLEQLTKVKYMSLHFEMDEGKEFYEEFKLLENLRDVNILEYNRTLKGKKVRDWDISRA